MLRESNGHYWDGETEITKEEYDAKLEVIYAKIRLVNAVYEGTASINDCPEEWREEIERRVEEMKAEDDPDPDIDEADAFEFLFGGAV